MIPDIHSIPDFVIVETAKKVQEKNGRFSATDLYFALFSLSRQNVHQYRNRKTGRYLVSVVQKAGAIKLPVKSGRGECTYAFIEKEKRS